MCACPSAVSSVSTFSSPLFLFLNEFHATQELMVDPVLAEDELTYERSAIEAWLTNHRTSPADPLRALR